jgi:pyrroline-5-carboxylate reductase
MRIAFIGGGNMAEGMLVAVLRKRLASAGEVVVAEPQPSRRQWLKKKYRVEVAEEGPGAIAGTGLVVLAVKPQDLAGVLEGLKGRLAPEQLLLSVVAGATLATLQHGHRAAVRAMPNINARGGTAVTLWTAAPQVTPTQRELSGVFLGSLGHHIYTDEEKHLDMATALSGSGPAYVFLFIEALTDAGVHIGLPRPLAAELAVHTVSGSAGLAVKTGTPPAQLREMVVSPGGTTAEALLRLEEGGFRGLITRAVVAAYEKSQGLGKRG